MAVIVGGHNLPSQGIVLNKQTKLHRLERQGQDISFNCRARHHLGRVWKRHGVCLQGVRDPTKKKGSPVDTFNVIYQTEIGYNEPMNDMDVIKRRMTPIWSWSRRKTAPTTQNHHKYCWHL